jgi:hypothetical protein
MLLPSTFGWILSGRRPGTLVNSAVVIYYFRSGLYSLGWILKTILRYRDYWDIRHPWSKPKCQGFEPSGGVPRVFPCGSSTQGSFSSKEAGYRLPSNRPKTEKLFNSLTKKNIEDLMQIYHDEMLNDCFNFSSYWKLVRTTAWIFRFLNNIRRREILRWVNSYWAHGCTLSIV